MSLRIKGFTLIEVMIAVVVVGILAAIAYPSFLEQMRKARRADAKTALLTAAQTLERFYTENNTYVGATAGGAGSTIPNWAPTDRPFANRTYDVVIWAQAANSFELRATPTGVQASDPNCGVYTLTNTGAKGMVSLGTVTQCW